MTDRVGHSLTLEGRSVSAFSVTVDALVTTDQGQPAARPKFFHVLQAITESRDVTDTVCAFVGSEGHDYAIL